MKSAMSPPVSFWARFEITRNALSEISMFFMMIAPNPQDLRCAAGWRAGYSAVGMTAKRVAPDLCLAALLAELLIEPLHFVL